MEETLRRNPRDSYILRYPSGRHGGGETRYLRQRVGDAEEGPGEPAANIAVGEVKSAGCGQLQQGHTQTQTEDRPQPVVRPEQRQAEGGEREGQHT